MPNKCVVCGSSLSSDEIAQSDFTTYHCPVCGAYVLNRSAVPGLGLALTDNPIARAKISHWIRGNQSDDKYLFTIDSKNYKEALENVTLPKVPEQADLLLLSIGDEVMENGPGHSVPIKADSRRATLGTLTGFDVVYLFQGLSGEGLLELEDKNTPAGKHRLTFKGWRKYDALKRGKLDSKRAFMAMPYGVSELDSLYTDYYIPAVGKTGFSLRRLDEEPKAGLIDNNMLIAVRNARFVVAEITNENAGVVWEAGFAEGEGKTVIYSCSDEYWKKRHFDLRNRQTVRWSPDKMEKAAKDLEACIRATFAGETLVEKD